MVKKCCTCKKEKDISEFAKNKLRKDGLQHICKSCRKDYDNKRYYNLNNNEKSRLSKKRKFVRERNRKFIFDYVSSHHCIDCGETDPIVLTFDHVSGQKKYNVSTMIRGNSIDAIKNEISKCEMRCFNCHARATAKRGMWFKYLNKKL